MLHIGRNILSLVVSRILAGVILFLIYTRLAQYLGPEAAGQYGLLAGFLMVFSMFVDLGMSQLVIKKVSEDVAHAGKFLNNYFSIQLLLALTFGLIMSGFVYFADYPAIVKNSLYVTSFGLFLSSLSLPFRSIINAFQKLTVIAKVNFGNSLINASFMLMAIFFRQDIFFLAFISVTVSAFDILFYGIYTHLKYARFRPEFDWVFVRQLFVWTFPFMLLTFFSIYNRIDTLMIPHFRSFEETGYYAAAYKFWDVLAFLPAVVGISLYPYFAKQLSVNNKENARMGLETYTRYMIALALPLSVGAFLLADQITLAFYGQDFLPAAPALWLLVAAVSILIIYSPANSLVISQQTRLATKVTGFTLLFNFGTNLILIPRYGFVAAAATTVASELIQLLGYSYIIKKRVVDYNFFRHFVKPAIAASIMAAAVILLKDYSGVWGSIGIGVFSYSLSLLLLKFFHKEDWQLFKAAIDIRKNIDVEKEPI